MSTPLRPPETVSLPWLLGRSDLGLVHAAGPAGADVQVRWAHSIELVDPTPWLQGGELVLLTGVRLPRSALPLAAYVHRLASVGVAALGFGTGVSFEKIPSAVVSACDEVGLPLVEVPLATPFLAVVHAVADEIAAQRQRALQEAFDFQRRLVAVALAEGVQGLVDATAAQPGWRVLLLDQHEEVVSTSPGATGLRKEVVAALAGADHPASMSLGAADRHLAVLRVGPGQRPLGWLAVEGPHAPDARELLVLHQVASMLALQLARSADLEARHRALGSAVLGQLLAGAAAGDLSDHGLPRDGPLRLVVAVPGRHGRKWSGLADLLARLDVAHLHRHHDDVEVVLLGGDTARSEVDGWAAQLAAYGPGEVVFGVSDLTVPAGIPAALDQARAAAEEARTGHARVGWYAGLGLAALLADPYVRERVHALTGSALTTLLVSTRERDVELVRTLRAYLEHNGSWEGASRALEIHRHTLRQRVGRLRALGLDVDHPHERAAMLLALAARPD